MDNSHSAPPRILSIAGSDPSGGAGIQADIKTITALGGYAMTALTALTVQNTLGVTAIQHVAPEMMRDQARACLDDIGADIIKIGMVGTRQMVEMIADLLCAYPNIPVILDPILAATSKDALAEPGVERILCNELLPLVNVVTPNIPEAEYLSGMNIKTTADMAPVACSLQVKGAKNVLLKGGHLQGSHLEDHLYTQRNGVYVFTHARIETAGNHGTGCTLAAALATFLGQHMDLKTACAQAIEYVQTAIKAAPGFGTGQRPLGCGTPNPHRE